MSAAADQNAVLEFLNQGYVTFVLDVDMGGGSRKVEGLATLQGVKKIRRDAFCAIMTGYPFHEERAMKFGADYFCGKTAKDLRELAVKLNEAYLHRCLNVGGSRLTLNILGERLRKESLKVPSVQKFEQLKTELKTALQYIEPFLKRFDYKGAAQEMVLLEPTLRTMASFSETLRDGLGIGIHALLNAAKQVSKAELTPAMWDCWRTTLQAVPDNPSLSSDRASDFADELDTQGFNTEPPNWSAVTQILSSLESSDLHSTASDLS